MAWNVFKFCTALRALGSIMIVFVLVIIGITYYSVVLAYYGPSLFLGGFDTISAIVVLFLFHFLLLMVIWSYTSVVLTDPGGVPPNWRPPRDEEKGDADPLVGSSYGSPVLGSYQLAVPADSTNQDIRFCRKCNQLKPPRTHHCSVCKRCVLKMDRPSLCLGCQLCWGTELQVFLSFLGITVQYYMPKKPQQKMEKIVKNKNGNRELYTFLGTTVVSLSLLPIFMKIFNGNEIIETPGTLVATFITFVLNIAFGLSVLGFLIMHITLVGSNTTTIEAYEKKTSPKWRYDLGWRKNFEQVFGTKKKFWFIPAYSEDDLKGMPSLQGFEYPTRTDWVPPLQQHD